MSRFRSVLFGAGTAIAAAAAGSLGARRAPEVYAQLDKPGWAPPRQVFGPVWSTLYTAVGVAGSRLSKRDAGPLVLGLHVAQLALNAAWPATFFLARDRSRALAVVLALDAIATAEIAVAARRDRTAAALLVPYLAWSLYATALTAAVRFDPPPHRQP